MFSDKGRADYEPSRHRNRQNVLDVLQRLGINSVWRDNNSGCKGVCDRLNTADILDFRKAALCDASACYDEAMLEGLAELINSPGQHKLILMHQLGSHGPAYYKRYPKKFERFTPACQRQNVAECQQSEIVNAYDNTILYTDHFLASIIDVLKQQTGVASSLVYLSDHGESLGERGVYLHGLPYFMAPSQQTHVPMLMWFSKQYPSVFGIDTSCLRSHRQEAASHDNLFHSLLGLYGVSSSVYQQSLDIFAPCRAASGANSR
jgi:lipid A ethanolaminephosphotransferase